MPSVRRPALPQDPAALATPPQPPRSLASTGGKNDAAAAQFKAPPGGVGWRKGGVEGWEEGREGEEGMSGKWYFLVCMYMKFLCLLGYNESRCYRITLFTIECIL